MRKRKKTIAEEAATRELVALVDGPWRLCWYWRDDFEALQEVCRRYPPAHPSGQMQSYRRTKGRVNHPQEAVSGTAYRYQPEAS